MYKQVLIDKRDVSALVSSEQEMLLRFSYHGALGIHRSTMIAMARSAHKVHTMT